MYVVCNYKKLPESVHCKNGKKNTFYKNLLKYEILYDL
jgi:hypothetical protein